MKKRILFVDDQPEVLKGLRRTLYLMTDEWDMEFVDTGEKALEIVERMPPDVIVSDMRMPGMDGAELMNRVSKRAPSVLRIILSGHSDSEMILKSVGPTHQFLAKPLNSEKLKETLSRAFGLRDMLADSNLMRLVANLKSLPSLPTLYKELMAELQSPDVSPQRLGEIISRDVGMTAKIMQLVNSSFFGLPVHVTDPIHAVKLLGSVTLRALVLSVQVFAKFENVRMSGLSIEEFTNHSLAVASVAKNIVISEKQSNEMADNALIAGMLHDIGKLIIAENLPEAYQKCIAYAKDNNATVWEAENSTIGCTHAEVGAYLLGIWGLPEEIVEAVAFHHNPLTCSAENVSSLTAVYAANALEHQEDDRETGSSHTLVHSEYLDKLGLVHRVSEWNKICIQSKQKRETR